MDLNRMFVSYFLYYYLITIVQNMHTLQHFIAEVFNILTTWVNICIIANQIIKPIRRMKCCLHPHILRTNIFLFDHWTESCSFTNHIQLFQISLSPSKAEKSNTCAKGLLGIANKIINFLAIPSKPFALVFDFPLCSETTLIEIAIYAGASEGGAKCICPPPPPPLLTMVNNKPQS
jgi:hypothetical protein